MSKSDNFLLRLRNKLLITHLNYIKILKYTLYFMYYY